MKVLEVSDFHKVGGAAIAAQRISDCLTQRKLNFHRISSHSSEPDSTLFLGKKIQFLKGILDMTKFTSHARRITLREINRQFNLILQRYDPDFILFHNIHGASWPIELVVSATNHSPTTWILHDCWSFLGTYYPSHSPVPSQNIIEDLQNFWNKKIPKSEKRHSFSAITPSKWMSERAKTSYWSEYPVEVIHNPIPNSFFKNRDRSSCKKSLGLKEGCSVILCIAGNLDEPRKGGGVLEEIIRSTCNDNVQFLVVGEGHLIRSIDSEKVKRLGFIKDEITLQIVYSASDILIHTAPIDNLPNTVAESMSCGTPVLAFETGGIPEMVIPKKSGWLVKKINAESMILELKEILMKNDYENLRKSTQSVAKLLFDQDKVARSYENHLLEHKSFE